MYTEILQSNTAVSVEKSRFTRNSTVLYSLSTNVWLWVLLCDYFIFLLQLLGGPLLCLLSYFPASLSNPSPSFLPPFLIPPLLCGSVLLCLPTSPAILPALSSSLTFLLPPFWLLNCTELPNKGRRHPFLNRMSAGGAAALIQLFGGRIKDSSLCSAILPRSYSFRIAGWLWVLQLCSKAGSRRRLEFFSCASLGEKEVLSNALTCKLTPALTSSHMASF